MSPIICRCCGQHIEPAPEELRNNPNVCAACEASRGFETQLFEREMKGSNASSAEPLPGPMLKDVRPLKR